MTTGSDSTSLQNQRQDSPTNTNSIENIAQKIVESPSYENKSIGTGNLNRTVGFETSVSRTPEASPTVAEAQPIEPSIDDAELTSFIDIKSLGVDSWPILGVEKWEGKVIEVDNEIFTAELKPLGSKDRATPLTSEFRMKVFEGKRVEPGDTFYLTAQDVRLRGLLITAYSFHIRKPGNWTVSDLDDIQARTRQRLELLKDNVE